MGGSRCCFTQNSSAFNPVFNKTCNKIALGEGGRLLLSKRSLKALGHREFLRSLFQRFAGLIPSCLRPLPQIDTEPGRGAGKQNPLSSKITENAF